MSNIKQHSLCLSALGHAPCLVQEEVSDSCCLDPGNVGSGAGENTGFVLHSAADGAEAHYAVHLPAVPAQLAQQRTTRVTLEEEERERCVFSRWNVSMTDVILSKLVNFSQTWHAAGGSSVSLNPAQIMESRTRSPQNFFCRQVLKSMIGRRAWFRASARDTFSFPPEMCFTGCQQLKYILVPACLGSLPRLLVQQCWSSTLVQTNNTSNSIGVNGSQTLNSNNFGDSFTLLSSLWGLTLWFSGEHEEELNWTEELLHRLTQMSPNDFCECRYIAIIGSKFYFVAYCS